MKQTRPLMGMPITVEILGSTGTPENIESVFSYFTEVDETFSTYKESSEISRINRGELTLDEAGADMREVFHLAKQTKDQTRGYFDILTPGGLFDPSGLVKGWAIWKAADLLKQRGCADFFIEAGGDVQTKRPAGQMPWKVGIQNPFKKNEIIKVLFIRNEGVATSGTYIRGQHIYNPHNPAQPITDISSITVVGPNVYEADRFATAAFAMGNSGIDFIEQQPGLEGYQINPDGIATMTSGFQKYTTLAD